MSMCIHDRMQAICVKTESSHWCVDPEAWIQVKVSDGVCSLQWAGNLSKVYSCFSPGDCWNILHHLQPQISDSQQKTDWWIIAWVF